MPQDLVVLALVVAAQARIAEGGERIRGDRHLAVLLDDGDRGHSITLRKSASNCGEIGVEARRQRAVDDAMVGGQRQRQHQARHEGLAVPHRLHGRLADAEDGHFRRIDDGREGGAADAADGRRS